MSDPAAFVREVADRHPRCFWLDGGGAREWSGRRSIVGWLDDDDVSLSFSAARREVVRHAGGRAEVVGDDVFDVLGDELEADGTGRGQWFGYLGYAARPDLPADPDPWLPDAVWLRPSHVRLFDHPVEGPSPGSGSERGRVPQADITTGVGHTTPPPADYAAAFATVQEHLHAGNTYEANLTYRLDRPGPADPLGVYLRLRELNPAPYAGFLQHDVDGARAWLLSSSPERFALVVPAADGRGRVVETKPIKGTTPRGAAPADDELQRHRLATDPRYRAENLMIVDLLRHDLAQVCEVGSVEVPSLMAVESYAAVHQLVSTVRGRLRDDVTTLDALRALFPAGSMTGAPKLRTMQVIGEVESTPRGAYAGAFGWVAADGRADLGVVIRTLLTRGDGGYRLGTGGGITVHSDLDGEWAESRLKAERLLRALDC